jgi:hypothetical protein
LANVTEDCWIDEHSAEWVDESHVQRREATHRHDVDGPEQTVAPGALLEGEDREGMDGGVSNLADGLEGTNVDNREWAIRGTRLNGRLHSVFVREAVDEGLGTGSPSRGVPPKDATEPRAQLEQGTHDGVERHEILGAHEGSRIGKSAVESAAWKLDHPHIVEGDVGEKLMRTKIQPPKFRWIYARPSPHSFLFAAV